MARTLLEGVNEVLKKVKILDEDSGELTTLTDSARQVYIDTAVQVLNETIDELYSPTVADISKPKMLKRGQLTLVSGERTAKLAATSVALRREFHLVDRTNNHVISILDEDGFAKLLNADLQQDDTGLPSTCAIDQTSERQIMFDRAPTAAEAGNVYHYYYDRDFELENAGDEFPFVNAVFRSVIPAAAELWKLYQHQEMSDGLFNRSLARAAARLSGLSQSSSYNPPRSGGSVTDPLQG